MSSQYIYTIPKSLYEFSKNFVRIKKGPLDNSSVFASLNDFKWYLSDGKDTSVTLNDLTEEFKKYVQAEETGYCMFLPYVGQIVSIVENGKVTIVKITDTDNWKYEVIDGAKSAEMAKIADFDAKFSGLTSTVRLKTILAEPIGGTCTLLNTTVTIGGTQTTIIDEAQKAFNRQEQFIIPWDEDEVATLVELAQKTDTTYTTPREYAKAHGEKFAGFMHANGGYWYNDAVAYFEPGSTVPTVVPIADGTVYKFGNISPIDNQENTNLILTTYQKMNEDLGNI